MIFKSVLKSLLIFIAMSSFTAFAMTDFDCKVDAEKSKKPFNSKIETAKILILSDSRHDLRIRMYDADKEQVDSTMCDVLKADDFECYDRDALTLEFDVPAFSGTGLDLEKQQFSILLTEIRRDAKAQGKSIAFVCKAAKL